MPELKKHNTPITFSVIACLTMAPATAQCRKALLKVGADVACDDFTDLMREARRGAARRRPRLTIASRRCNGQDCWGGVKSLSKAAGHFGHMLGFRRLFRKERGI